MKNILTDTTLTESISVSHQVANESRSSSPPFSSQTLNNRQAVYELHPAYPSPSLGEVEMPSLRALVKPFCTDSDAGKGAKKWTTRMMRSLFLLAGYRRFQCMGKQQLEALMRYCHFRGFGYMPINQMATLVISDDEGIKHEFTNGHALTSVAMYQACLVRAASLILATLELRKAYLNGELEADAHRGRKKEMGQYANLFGTHTNFAGGGPSLYKTTSSNAVAVLLHGQHYILRFDEEKLNALSSVVRFQQLLMQLQTISLHAREDKICSNTKGAKELENRFSAGWIAAASICTNKLVWKKSKYKKQHRDYLTQLKECLFTVCIDAGIDAAEFGAQTNETAVAEQGDAARKIHSDNFFNRWHHASMQIVVLANAKAGLMVNFDACVDGNAMMRSGEEVYRRACVISKAVRDAEANTKSLDGAVESAESVYIYHHLPWRIEANYIERAQEDINSVTDLSQEATFCLPIGKADFAEAKLAPVPAFVIALAMAVHRLEGKVPGIGQALDMSHHACMGISGAEVSTPLTKHFIEQFARAKEEAASLTLADKNKALSREQLRDALEQAINSQLAICRSRRSSLTQDVMTQIFVRSRKGIQNIWMAGFGMLLHRQGIDFKMDIMISHPQLFDNVPLLGRPGARLMYLNTFGLHYQLAENQTLLTLMPAVDWQVKNKDYVATLQACLKDVLSLS